MKAFRIICYNVRMDQTERTPRQIFYALDGMRGVAAIAVVERHKPDFLFGQAWPSGYLAVDLFFILSGFVIAHAYEDKLRAGLSFSRFALTRIIRLYPLYILATLLSTVLFAVYYIQQDGTAPWSALATTFATAVFFLPTPEALSIDGTRLFPLNDPAWSLFFEIAINMIFAIFILRMSLRVMTTLAVLSATSLVLTFLYFGSADIGFDWGNFWGGFPRVSSGFFIGVLLYRLYQNTLHKTEYANWSWPVQMVLLSAFIIPVSATWRPAYDIAACLILFPLLVHIAARTTPGRLSTKCFMLLGASSYGIYVFHIPAARATKAIVEKLGYDIASLTPWIGFGFIAALFVGSIALDYLFDRPLRRALTKRYITNKNRIKEPMAAIQKPKARQHLPATQ